MGQQILLVEGRADTIFYQAVCRGAGKPRVLVKPPTLIGARVDSKTNAIHQLPALLKQLNDGSITNLGLIVDADYDQEHGLGFHKTLLKVREQVKRFGFENEVRLARGGFTFSHPDGLPTIGLWIMPDNRSDGMLEDFIQSAIHDPDQRKLHETACAAVAGLAQPLFKHFHRAKAEVATWLAWQRVPGAPAESAIGNKLIDFSSAAYQSLNDWIADVFA
jgi:hypothetical protein